MPRHRRGRGEGSIYKRKSDDLFCYQKIVGYDENGKAIKRTIARKSRAELLEVVRSHDLSAASSGWENRTVADLFSHWMQIHKSKIRLSTYEHDEAVVRNHILPSLGGVKLKHLTTERLQEYYSYLQSRRVNRPAEIAHILLKAALQHAVDKKRLGENPAKLVDILPKARLASHGAWNADEVARFLDVAKDSHYFPLFLVEAFSGLRIGELLGIEWESVYWHQSAITVKHQLLERNGKHVVGPPKSKRGVRLVALPASAMAVLESERKKNEAATPPPFLIDEIDEQGVVVRTDVPRNLIFRSPEGNLVRRSNFERRSFVPLIAKAGVRKIRFHDLRHTQASLLQLLEVNTEVVAKRLGHDVRVLLSSYSHSDLKQQAAAAEKFERLIEEGSRSPTGESRKD